MVSVHLQTDSTTMTKTKGISYPETSLQLETIVFTLRFLREFLVEFFSKAGTGRLTKNTREQLPIEYGI